MTDELTTQARISSYHWWEITGQVRVSIVRTANSIISIIVVGKNENWRLSRCLESIDKLIKKESKYIFEVIYIDSNSSDDSIKRAEKFNYVKIYLISGETNSAIARNIGAKNSKGEILFFIDGDMEVEATGFFYAIRDAELNNHIVTGHVDDYFYDGGDNFLYIRPRTYINRIPYETELLLVTGGLMFVNRKSWEALGGMSSKYKRCQDLDFCLRANETLGHFVHRLPHLLARHHSVEYTHEDRMWQTVKQGYYFYPGLLLRDHFFSPLFFIQSMRANWSAGLLFISLLSLSLNIDCCMVFPLFYLLANLVYVFIKFNLNKSRIKKRKSIILMIIYKIIVDLSFIFGLLFFFPKSIKEEYVKIR